MVLFSVPILLALLTLTVRDCKEHEKDDPTAKAFSVSINEGPAPTPPK